MKIIDGKALASELRAELQAKIEKMSRKPGLAVVIVGEDPASQIYVRNKIKACKELGITSFSYELPKNSSQKEVERLLDRLAQTSSVVSGVVPPAIFVAVPRTASTPSSCWVARADSILPAGVPMITLAPAISVARSEIPVTLA